MNTWERWKTRPQSVWLRRALFQVHLWTGIGVGLYVLLMSVSGSAIVFRRELARAFSREPRVVVGPGPRMSEDELRRAAKRAYPDDGVTRIWLGKNPDQAAEIWLERRGKSLQRLFNPYTGADLGDSVRPGLRVLLWFVDLHDNLLLGKTGQLFNAAGGILSVLLGLTGAVIWWPGSNSWRRSLNFRGRTNPKGFNWTFHSALGFWSLLFFVMWGVSGVYLSIPSTFNAVVDFLEPWDPPKGTVRAGDQVLNWLAKLHFGRFAGAPVKVIWTLVGLVPAALFVTGLLMWWRRVLKPWMRRGAVEAPLERAMETRPSENSVHAGP